MKYKNCDADKKEIVFQESKIDTDADIILVEGAIDCIYGPNTISMLGKTLTKDSELYRFLYQKANGRIIICLDNDTQIEETKKIYNLLNFGRLKDRGYGGVLDINDAMYGRFKANAPIIVFDNSAWVTKSNRRVRMGEKKFDTYYTLGRKALPVIIPAAAGVAAYNNTIKDGRGNSKYSAALLKRIEAVGEYLDNHGAFERVSRGEVQGKSGAGKTAKAGTTIYFTVDEKLNEDAGEFVILMTTDSSGSKGLCPFH